MVSIANTFGKTSTARVFIRSRPYPAANTHTNDASAALWFYWGHGPQAVWRVARARPDAGFVGYHTQQHVRVDRGHCSDARALRTKSLACWRNSARLPLGWQHTGAANVLSPASLNAPAPSHAVSDKDLFADRSETAGRCNRAWQTAARRKAALTVATLQASNERAAQALESRPRKSASAACAPSRFAAAKSVRFMSPISAGPLYTSPV